MAEQRYRFGGPIPETVQRIKERRAKRQEQEYWLGLEGRQLIARREATQREFLEQSLAPYVHSMSVPCKAPKESQAVASISSERVLNELRAIRSSLEMQERIAMATFIGQDHL